MRIRTAIFSVYVAASAAGLAVLMTLVLRDVRLRYVESMRRTLGDTAVYLAAYAAPATADEAWSRKLSSLPGGNEGLRVFACDPAGRVLFDSANRDVGQVYRWTMTGGGPNASQNYTTPNLAEVGNELRVAAPVRLGTALVGWVGVGRPLATVAEGVNAARWRLAGTAAGIAALMLVAGWWIAARLTRSLERLTTYAHDVRDGRAAAPPASRAREIAELGRAFEEMRESLEGRQRMERYTQVLTHEVKTPLAAIRGAAELLDESMPEEQRRRFLANIRNETARIQQIVERLLELSSLEARKALHAAEPVGAAELAGEAAAAVRNAYAARRLELAVEAAPGLRLHGEKVLLREALVNLLQNALDFSPAGGRVVLRVVAGPGRVEFVVEDSGPGVPDYALPRVFERFYSLPRPEGGRKSTGLGLSLLREIAHLHRGDASLANRPEGGARAVFWVPAA